MNPLRGCGTAASARRCPTAPVRSAAVRGRPVHHRLSQRQVTGREDVGPVEGDDEEASDCPRTDPRIAVSFASISSSELVRKLSSPSPSTRSRSASVRKVPTLRRESPAPRRASGPVSRSSCGSGSRPPYRASRRPTIARGRAHGQLLADHLEHERAEHVHLRQQLLNNPLTRIEVGVLVHQPSEHRIRFPKMSTAA